MVADARGAKTEVDIRVDEAAHQIQESSGQSIDLTSRSELAAAGGSEDATNVDATNVVVDLVAHTAETTTDADATVIDLRTAEPIVELETLTPSGLAAASRSQLAWKRAMDIVIAGAALIALSPLFLAVAAAIKLTSKGPVFFKQPRVGKNGELFDFVKFRSMRTTAVYEKPQLRAMNEKDGPIFKIRNDPRITKVGKVIRKLSIDELPQLSHVLSGKMSLVGPRPHLPEEVDAYDARAHRRLQVQPGITCIWQVSGRADLDFDTWIDLDLRYIDTWSPALDAKLLAQTIPAVLTGKGAY